MGVSAGIGSNGQIKSNGISGNISANRSNQNTDETIHANGNFSNVNEVHNNTGTMTLSGFNQEGGKVTGNIGKIEVISRQNTSTTTGVSLGGNPKITNIGFNQDSRDKQGITRNTVVGDVEIAEAEGSPINRDLEKADEVTKDTHRSTNINVESQTIEYANNPGKLKEDIGKAKKEISDVATEIFYADTENMPNDTKDCRAVVKKDETGKYQIYIDMNQIDSTSNLIGTLFEEISHSIDEKAERQQEMTQKQKDRGEYGLESLDHPTNDYFKEQYKDNGKEFISKGDGLNYMKNNVLYIFLLCKVCFSIGNSDIILNSDKFLNDKIMEVRKISYNGYGEIQKLYFYKDGTVDNIIFKDDGSIFIEKLKIKSKNDILFLNNLSIEAIDSVKNDSFVYIQNHNNNIKLREFIFYNSFNIGEKVKVDLEKILEEIPMKYNNQEYTMNYSQITLHDELSNLKDSMYLYEVRYKNKYFILSNKINLYENKEIKKLLELIETPFFVFYDREEIEKYNAINLQIEKIEFLDDRHYNLKRYIIFDDKLIEINFQKTNNINQVDVIEKEYKINKEIQNKIKNLKADKKEEISTLEYSYERNSLDEINNTKLRNKKMKVKFRNRTIENPTIYKVYNKSLNADISIKNFRVSRKYQFLIDYIEKLNVGNAKIKNISKIKEKNFIEILDIYANEDFRNIKYLDYNRQTNYGENLELRLFSIDLELSNPISGKKIDFSNLCNDIEYNYENIGFINYDNYIIIGDTEKLHDISKKLKNKFKYKGDTIIENVEKFYKKYEKYCNYDRLIKKDKIFQNLK